MKTSIPQQLLERARNICSRIPLSSAVGSRAAISLLLLLALSWSLVLPFTTQAAPKPVAKPNLPTTTETSSLPQTTEKFIVYGPQRFTRLTGQAVNIVQKF